MAYRCRLSMPHYRRYSELVIPGNVATRRFACMSRLLMSGKIVLTATRTGRQHGRAAGQTRSQGGRAARARCLNPHPEQVDRPGVLVQRVLRRPRRGAGQIRDGAEGQGGRRPCHRGRRGVRVLPARPTTRQPPRWNAPGWRGSSGQARAARRPQADRGDLRLGRAAAGRRSRSAPSAASAPDRGVLRRARAPPLRRARAGPPPGAPLQKPLTCPPARCGRRSTRPCPCSHHLASRLLNRATARMPGQDTAPGGGLDARYEQLRHAALHARATRSRSASAC